MRIDVSVATSHTSNVKLVAALIGAAALLLPAAASPDAAPYTIVGGTWVNGWEGQLVGPAWWLDGPTQTYGVTMVGPGGFTKHMGGPNQRFPGMPSTRSIYWCSTCGDTSPGGSWYAIGDGDHTQETFTIDQSSRLQPIVIGQYSGDANTFTASWTADSNAQSFIAYVQDEGDTSATDWIVGQELPGTARSVTFANMGLNPDWGYEFDVFAFSGDIAGGSAPTVFNIASNRIDFVPSVLAANGPQTGPPRPICEDGCGCLSCAIGPSVIIPPPLRICGSLGPGLGWSLSAGHSVTCPSAKTLFHTYVSNEKCSTSGKSSRACTVKTYDCDYTRANKSKTVRCTSSKGEVMFKSNT